MKHLFVIRQYMHGYIYSRQQYSSRRIIVTCISYSYSHDQPTLLYSFSLRPTAEAGTWHILPGIVYSSSSFIRLASDRPLIGSLFHRTSWQQRQATRCNGTYMLTIQQAERLFLCCCARYSASATAAAVLSYIRVTSTTAVIYTSGVLYDIICEYYVCKYHNFEVLVHDNPALEYCEVEYS